MKDHLINLILLASIIFVLTTFCGLKIALADDNTDVVCTNNPAIVTDDSWLQYDLDVDYAASAPAHVWCKVE